MINPKLHDEFKAIDMTTGWETPPGYPEGIQQKILAGWLDEAAKTGNRSRLLRFAPGVHTTKPFVHEYWEEVLLISGDLTVGNDERGEGGEPFAPLTFACRPPRRVSRPIQVQCRLPALRNPLLRVTNRRSALRALAVGI